MKQEIDYFGFITKTVMWVLGIIAIYMLILKIFSHSPTLESILMVIVGIISANLLFLNYQMGRQEGKFDQFEHKIKESFDRIKDDLEEIKRRK